MNKTVVYMIDTHPIEKPLLEKLRIYTTPRVEPVRVGTVLTRLIKAGFVNINTVTEYSSFGFNRIIVTMHLTKNKDENGVYLK